MQRVESALQALGRAIDRLDTALVAHADQRVEAAETQARLDHNIADLRGEYDSLRGEYAQLRQVVTEVNGRLDGTVSRLRTLLEE